MNFKVILLFLLTEYFSTAYSHPYDCAGERITDNELINSLFNRESLFRENHMLYSCNNILKTIFCSNNDTISKSFLNFAHDTPKEKQLKQLFFQHCSYLLDKQQTTASKKCDSFNILDVTKAGDFKSLKCNYAAQVSQCSSKLKHLSSIYLKLYCKDYIKSDITIAMNIPQIENNLKYPLFRIFDESLENAKLNALREIEIAIIKYRCNDVDIKIIKLFSRLF